MMKNNKKTMVILLATGMLLATGCGHQQASNTTLTPEVFTNRNNTSGTSADMTLSASTSAEPITEEKAKEIALAHVGLTEAVFTEHNYDRSDGVYELTFYADGKEYEFEVNAANGNIVEKDIDHDDLDVDLDDYWDDRYDDDWDDRYDDDWDDRYDDDWDDCDDDGHHDHHSHDCDD